MAYKSFASLLLGITTIAAGLDSDTALRLREEYGPGSLRETLPSLWRPGPGSGAGSAPGLPHRSLQGALPLTFAGINLTTTKGAAYLQLLLSRRQNWGCSIIDLKTSGAPWDGMTPQECAARYEQLKHERDSMVRRRTGLLFFHHIHKAGGTTLCAMAKHNVRCDMSSLPRKADWNTNCVPKEAFMGWRPRLQPYNDDERTALKGPWLGAACWFADLSVTQQRSVRAHFPKLQFIASEGSLPDRVYLGSGYSFITMLRHPLDRALSSYHWWKVLVEEFKRHGTRTASLCQTFYAPNNATFSEWLEYYRDNWMTRSYAGRTAMYSSRPVTEREFLRAISRLHYYSAVLIMERFSENIEVMQNQFGWADVDAEGHRQGSKRNSNAMDELQGQPELLEKLRKLHYWDMLLYDYAQVLFQQQLTSARKLKALKSRSSLPVDEEEESNVTELLDKGTKDHHSLIAELLGNGH